MRGYMEYIPRSSWISDLRTFDNSYAGPKTSSKTRSLEVSFHSRIYGGVLSTLRIDGLYLSALKTWFILDKGGFPHLTRNRSHNAMWNYLGTPHDNGVHGTIQSEMETTTRELWHFDVYHALIYPRISWSPKVLDSRRGSHKRTYENNLRLIMGFI
jgi:hypothetical protein